MSHALPDSSSAGSEWHGLCGQIWSLLHHSVWNTGSRMISNPHQVARLSMVQATQILQFWNWNTCLSRNLNCSRKMPNHTCIYQLMTPVYSQFCELFLEILLKPKGKITEQVMVSSQRILMYTREICSVFLVTDGKAVLGKKMKLWGSHVGRNLGACGRTRKEAQIHLSFRTQQGAQGAFGWRHRCLTQEVPPLRTSIPQFFFVVYFVLNKRNYVVVWRNLNAFVQLWSRGYWPQRNFLEKYDLRLTLW